MGDWFVENPDHASWAADLIVNTSTTVNWTTASNGTASGSISGSGEVFLVELSPSFRTGPTTPYDVQIISNASDILSGEGDDSPNDETVSIRVTETVSGTLTYQIANGGNMKSGRITVHLRTPQ